VAAGGRVGHDPKTVRYFEEHTPDYGVGRLGLALDFVRRTPGAESLLDVGCGTGAKLAQIAADTPLRGLHGLDPSARSLERARERVECTTHVGSILDDEVVASLPRDFDFVLIASVLHHLIGRTRRASYALAAQALRAAVGLLRPGGHLIVLEPVYAPALAMDAVFYLKKGVSSVSDRRVSLFGSTWNNIGAPVVSYFTNERLEALVRGAGMPIVEREIEPLPLPAPVGAFLRKTYTTLIAGPAGAAA